MILINKYYFKITFYEKTGLVKDICGKRARPAKKQTKCEKRPKYQQKVLNFMKKVPEFNQKVLDFKVRILLIFLDVLNRLGR